MLVMFPTKALLSLILISLTSVTASPVTRDTGKATLSFVTKISAEGPRSLLEKDQARAQALHEAGSIGKRSTSFSVTNAVVTYTAQVAIGSPATDYTLLIDTGSSNTWVGAGIPYTPTSTSFDTGDTVSVSYGSGSFSGEEWIDTVTLTSGLTIPQQSIGVASTSKGFSGVDGILGVGPVDLTQGTVSNTFQVPTVSDNLFTQGTITQEVLGIYYVPASEPNSTGELTFGGYDSTVITSAVTYVPLTTTAPATYYWGINQSMSYGSTTILSTTAGIVDTGTTLVLIASNAYQTYKTLTGATVDHVTGLLKITSTQYANLQPLYFNIGGSSYELSPNAQIWPRSLNTAIGGSASAIYLIVNNLGRPSGFGLDFIDGYTFLERYYSVFDTANSQIGFATTSYTFATTN